MTTIKGECIHGLEYGCTICSGKDQRTQSEAVEYSYTAKHAGQCPECNLPILVGQRLVKTTRDRNLHNSCLR